ncbi:hypothetical protein [Niallia sp. 03133]|uniref:hypothetical protein n=1 Tax=Niallia sp. 03133 TaxID=3458060 RepID=UPI004043C56B
MKKSLSSFNLLQGKLGNENSQSKGFLHSLFTERKYITLKIPYYAYLRGKIFIEDLRDNYEEDVPYQFDVAFLIHMLYTDFMDQVKKGVKNEEVAAYLKKGKTKYFKKKEKRVLKPITNYILKLETVEEPETELESKREEKSAYIEMRMKEKVILRGEVLLFDLEPYLSGVSVSVEELISIIYLDFISSTAQQGNSTKIQSSIVQSLKN